MLVSEKEKSVSGIPLVPENVLSTAALKQNPGYYHTRVEPLFFEVLNTPIGDRKVLYREEPYQTIPFLNGGLFEPQSDDFYKNNTPNYALKVPDDWWEDFLEILETYNFTIDENTSIDIELSVDPEMLGRIFENLLAEINPETGETARKATGSYYTPRPIVEYMVNESLKQYLITKTGIKESRLDILLDYSKEESGLAPEEEQQVIRAFDTIKILDPACGSGAFPIGTLQKMLLILQKVDIEAEDSIRKVLEEISDPVKRKLIEAKIKAARIYEDVDFNDYARKLSIIQRSIYGIDIQPIATDISKLRFFLSMIVDEVVQDDQPNRGIEPLPNLEFKFVCANTLIPLPTRDVDKNLFEDYENIKKLEKIREDYFISYGKEKEKLKKDFNSVQARMFTHHLNTIQAYAQHKDSQTAKLIDWNPFKNEPASWFDAKWMFGVEEGFDIVIGNPPYVEHKKLKHISRQLKRYYSTFSGTADLYVCFYEQGIKSLKNKGFCTLISSNKFIKTEYGHKLRDYLIKNHLIEIIDFTNIHVFDALVASCVIIVQKEKRDVYSVVFTSCNDLTFKTGLSAFISLNKIIISNKSLIPDLWLLENNQLQNLKTKIESIGKKIKNIKSINSFRGVTTGYNPAFIINSEKKNQLYELDKKNSSSIKPILQGRHIKKWFYEDSGEYLLFIPWHFPLHKDNKISGNSLRAEKLFKKNYGSLYNHLLAFKEKLSSRNTDETGIRYEWYALQRCANTYYEEFEKSEKIIWGLTADKWAFAYDSEKHFLPSNGYILTSSEIPIKYILAILNSKVMKYYFGFIGIMTAGGAYTLKQGTVSDFPLAITKDSKSFISHINVILNNKHNQSLCIKKENQLDLMAYKLYTLSYEECKIVDLEIEKLISQKDYESKSIEELAEYEIKL